MSIQPISQATAAAAAAATAPSAPSATAPVSLGMGGLTTGSFLQLLTVQLKNQDPMNPMDPTAMLSQLAQFTSLQQSQELNSQMTSSQQQNSMTQGAALVGQDLHIQLQNGTQVEGLVQQVGWSNGSMTLQINGTQYPMSSVTAILPKQNTTG